MRANVTNEDSDKVPQDHVIRQDPPPGTKLAKNAVVALVVSGGLPRVQVPDVKTFSVSDAQRTLQNAKLRYKIVAAHDAAPGKGLLSSESPVAHALNGSKAGDVAVVTTPSGKRRFKVVAVS